MGISVPSSPSRSSPPTHVAPMHPPVCHTELAPGNPGCSQRRRVLTANRASTLDQYFPPMCHHRAHHPLEKGGGLEGRTVPSSGTCPRCARPSAPSSPSHSPPPLRAALTVSSPAAHPRLALGHFGYVLGTRPSVATHGA
eukprot:586709-Prorocentrum_minimum.AAC.2